MHTLTVGLMADHWRRHRDTSWMMLEGLAATPGLIASAFAEPGGSSNLVGETGPRSITQVSVDYSFEWFACSEMVKISDESIEH